VKAMRTGSALMQKTPLSFLVMLYRCCDLSAMINRHRLENRIISLDDIESLDFCKDVIIINIMSSSTIHRGNT